MRMRRRPLLLALRGYPVNAAAEAEFVHLVAW